MTHTAHIPLSPGGPSGGPAARDPVHANPPAEAYALLSSRPEGLAPEADRLAALLGPEGGK